MFEGDRGFDKESIVNGLSKIAKAAKKGGKVGRQARLAQTFAKMRKKK